MKNVVLLRFIPVLSALLFLGVTAVYGQSFQVRGLIQDQSTGEPVQFANVSLCGKAIGTASNEEGKFQINIPEEYRQDSLCISFIGYRTVKIALVNIPNPLTINLELNIQRLQEISVTTQKIPPVSVILKRAFKRIEKNYPSQPYLTEGYYRDYLVTPGETRDVLEAAIGLYDPGFHTQSYQKRVKIYQSRYDGGVPINYHDLYENNLGGKSGNIQIEGGSQLSVLMYNNPVRNYNRISDIITGYEFNQDFLNEHRVELEYLTQFDQQAVYCIKITANRYHSHYQSLSSRILEAKSYSLGGHIYIRADDYAILKFEYSLREGRGNEQKILNRVQVEYQNYQEHLYLQYLSFSNLITLKNGGNPKTYLHTRELFVNKVRTRDIPSPHSFYLFEQIGQIHRQDKLSDDSFWDQYNMVLKRENW